MEERHWHYRLKKDTIKIKHVHHSITRRLIALTLKTTTLRCDCKQRETNEWKTWVLISRAAALKFKKLHEESIKGTRS